jgi:antitoxin YefM
MDVIPYTRLRMNLAGEMDRVCADHAAIIVTRKASASVVMMSLDDYEALEETTHLLRSPKSARRLLESILELEAGGGAQRALMETDLAE